MASAAPPLPREVVAVDGKTVRRSFDCGRAQGPLHVVSALTQQGLSLGQVGVVGKGQELTAIPLLLSSLCLANTIVTLNALGCQHAIARQLLAQQADYILALKGNQRTCHRAVVAYCKAACFDLGAIYSLNYDAFDCRHGRWVRRRAWVLPVSNELAALREWPGLQEQHVEGRLLAPSLLFDKLHLVIGEFFLPVAVLLCPFIQFFLLVFAHLALQ